MLGNARVVGFSATTNPDRAVAFYRDKLGLSLVANDGFALVFDGNGTTIRVAIVHEVKAAPYTILGWEVDDVAGGVKILSERGVSFLRFGLPGQDESGVWTAPDGSQVAWFHDPDGNILSLSRHAPRG